MDEEQLKKILNIEVPPVDENARKRAVNLAVAQFKALENERENSFQGMSFLSRLIRKTTHKRRDSMEQASKRKLMYGGMATAMAVVLIAGTTFTQFQKGPAYVTGAEITAPPGTEEATPAYVAALQENKERVDQATGGSALPTPVNPPVGRLTVTDEKKDFAQAKAPTEFESDQLAAAAPVPMAPATSGLMMERKAAPAAKSMMMKQESFASRMSADSSAGAASNMAPYAPPPGIIMPEPVPQQPGYHDVGRDKFKDFAVSPVKIVAEEPVSTFSIDVDTSSYSFARSQLNNGVLPQKDAVRVEEMVNYFDYNYPLPETKEQPFKPTITVLDDPWSKDKKLVHIGIKGYDIPKAAHPNSNLVFLLDTSGSMNEPNKLPLVKNSLKMLLDSMDENDTISIVAYAGSAGTVLEPTKATEKAKIIAAIDNLDAGGSTAGAEGINLAYQLAEQKFDKEGVNRVILATDGDFNVGITSEEELKDFIERKRETGIFLSVLGFGQGNLNDSLMQTLAQNGNGAAAYIDNLNEARKVLVQEASSTLFPIAKDVKIQVEFNPAQVSEYRLVGYETRALNREDFNNDKVDAGDIGAGHAVTAIYEITPVGATPSVDNLRYGDAAKPQAVSKIEPVSDFNNELGFLKIRYKLPKEDTSKLITTPITMESTSSLTPSTCPPEAKCKMMAHSDDAAFAVAVAGFAQLLKGDQHVGSYTYDDVINLAQANKGDDPFGYRAEFINLVRLAKTAAAQ